MNKTYYKGLDANLCAMNDFQYEVGGEYTADTDDNWHWLHFTTKIDTALTYGCRVVEVQPLTKIQNFSVLDMNAKSIRIVRELPKEEIVTLLHQAKLLKKTLKYCLKKLEAREDGGTE